MIPKSECLNCQKLLWDNEPDKKPEDGMCAICVFCGEVMQFDKDLNLIHVDELLIPKEVKILSALVRLSLKTGYDFPKEIKDLYDSRKNRNDLQ